MDASCGPQNALSQLTKHTQRDTSLQHERQNYQENFQQNAFRNGPGHDAALNAEFQRFSQGNGREFQSQFSPHMQQQFLPQNHSFSGQNNGSKFNQIGTHDGRNHEWVSDFRGLSLQEGNRGQSQNLSQVQGQNQSQSQNRGVNSDWHFQFMQKMRQQGQSQGQYSNTNSALQNNQFAGAHNLAYQPMMGQANQQRMWSQTQNLQQNLQSRDQVHTPQIDDQALQRQFDMIEQELEQSVEAQNAQNNEKDKIDDTDKEQFAQAARKVQETMLSPAHGRSEETDQKFQQSSFLKLMTSIQSREVELSRDGEKLVNKSTGEDIRQYLSDPLKHERASESEPDYHVPPHDSASVPGGVSHANSETAPQKHAESDTIRSHLPDPLAHIRDGALGGDLSALEAARVVSGGQVQENSWMEDSMWDGPLPNTGTRPSLLSAAEQEVYDDYRNDDY